MSAGLLDKPNQEMICVDKSGKETGKIVDRKTAHSTPGIKHLAIQVLVFTPSNELILHKRPLTKVGGGVWDAPTTHVLNGESRAEAALRCLKDEYNIEVKSTDFVVLDGFSYEKDYEDGSCENEFCLAAYTIVDKEISAKNEHVEDLKKLSAKKVLEDINAGSEDYPVWLKRTIRIVADSDKGKELFTQP